MGFYARNLCKTWVCKVFQWSDREICVSCYGILFLFFFPLHQVLKSLACDMDETKYHMEWMNELAIKWLMYIHRSRYQMYWKLHRPFGMPKHTNSIWMRFNNVWKIIIFVIVCETNSIKKTIGVCSERIIRKGEKNSWKFHHFERKIDVYQKTTISIWAYEYLCRFSIVCKHNFRCGRYFADSVCQIS